MNAWWRIIQADKTIQGEDISLTRQDGSKAWVRVTATLVSENGKTPHIEGSIEDVTDRRAADERIARQLKSWKTTSTPWP